MGVTMSNVRLVVVHGAEHVESGWIGGPGDLVPVELEEVFKEYLGGGIVQVDLASLAADLQDAPDLKDVTNVVQAILHEVDDKVLEDIIEETLDEMSDALKLLEDDAAAPDAGGIQ